MSGSADGHFEELRDVQWKIESVFLLQSENFARWEKNHSVFIIKTEWFLLNIFHCKKKYQYYLIFLDIDRKFVFRIFSENIWGFSWCLSKASPFTTAGHCLGLLAKCSSILSKVLIILSFSLKSTSVSSVQSCTSPKYWSLQNVTSL